MAELTPMMKQYFEIKNKYKDYILFYRLGDFYEMFYEDAKLASRELELTLTGRDCGQEERAPMCGVPFHSYEGYVARLIRKGYKVAICEQIGDPKTTKGLVKREIVRMITPGTLIDASMLDENNNNFLACIYSDSQAAAVCFADISTGQVFATACEQREELYSELGRFTPREVLLGGAGCVDTALQTFISKRLEGICSPLPENCFDEHASAAKIEEQFHIKDFSAAGMDGQPLLLQCIGGLLSYLAETQKTSLPCLGKLEVYRRGQYMELDLNARRNLELCETMRGKEKRGSLLWVIDRTKTAMGSRLIRQWLEKPLLNPLHIKKRQDAVGELAKDVMLRSTLGDVLKKVFDMERLISRVVYGTANCRDLRALQVAAECLPDLHEAVRPLTAPLSKELFSRLDLLEDVRDAIACAVVDDPPVSVRDGGFIRPGYHPEIDELRDLSSGGKGRIVEIEQRERERTGIKTLKIRYNRVFGYYIEVTKSFLSQVPEDYIRKQTLANAERYITGELKDLESTVLGAQERLTALEYDLFVELRQRVAAQVHRIQRTAQAVAHLDVLGSLAELAAEQNYVCPEVDFSGVIEIKNGRHPVVERVLEGSLFIPNDTRLDSGENRVAIITGPNMAGKSTYMRQVAIITILAQMGSFVPAASARIGVVDRVFTRVGASDDLASGQSTFMVEMSEVADILRFATKNSLLILDEIGRGTSTYDGMSIARAVLEYAADKRKIGARTLFATHYHELTVLEDLVEGVKNYNIAVKKRGDDITFLRKIVSGGADESFGIEVAKLAGVPNAVIKRAKAVLKDLESNMPKIEVREVEKEEETQISMLDIGSNQVADRLRTMQVETMTPIEAMNALYELKKLL